ncbi:hypothetical protein K435DRAFT_851656 [Dendrothele bispora CBS 962.96]|uniref:Uncharacterized protein n=1 Tax=Dendrothele bispora (strain CBS 962.96) TaxID=1314807 RepID=A0A4S8MLG3_DENBC|nr:hypothetical protein K435DRAFT_851656 [Dendrothele bispora CBS 962.96]
MLTTSAVPSLPFPATNLPFFANIPPRLSKKHRKLGLPALDIQTEVVEKSGVHEVSTNLRTVAQIGAYDIPSDTLQSLDGQRTQAQSPSSHRSLHTPIPEESSICRAALDRCTPSSTTKRKPNNDLSHSEATRPKKRARGTYRSSPPRDVATVMTSHSSNALSLPHTASSLCPSSSPPINSQCSDSNTSASKTLSDINVDHATSPSKTITSSYASMSFEEILKAHAPSNGNLEQVHRKAALEADPWIASFTKTSVRCRGCGKTLQMEKRGNRFYYPSNWIKHRDQIGCKEIRAKIFTVEKAKSN